MLALTDVYCLYNRARVTDLISPDDLLSAARTLEALKPAPGVRLRTFPSGLRVLQHDAFSDAQMAERLRALLLQDEAAAAAAAMVAAGGGAGGAGAGAGAAGRAPAVAGRRQHAFVAAPQLAARLKMPLQVATQHLLVRNSPHLACQHLCSALARSLSPPSLGLCCSALPPARLLDRAVPPSSLQLAEAAGVLSRDDSINGLRFYLNKFA